MDVGDGAATARRTVPQCHRGVHVAAVARLSVRRALVAAAAEPERRGMCGHRGSPRPPGTGRRAHATTPCRRSGTWPWTRSRRPTRNSNPVDAGGTGAPSGPRSRLRLGLHDRGTVTRWAIWARRGVDDGVPWAVVSALHLLILGDFEVPTSYARVRVEGSSTPQKVSVEAGGPTEARRLIESRFTNIKELAQWANTGQQTAPWFK